MDERRYRGRGYSDEARELGRLFSEGFLLHPLGASPSSLDFSGRYLHAGEPPADIPGLPALMQDGTGHVVYVLVDGLGMNILEKAPRDGFLRTHFRAELSAVYPSTTATSFSSFYSGVWPCRHGITGWNIYLPEHHLTATVLPYIDRETKKPLSELGIREPDIFPVESLFDRMPYRVRSFFPEKYVTGGYTTWAGGGTPFIPYRNLTEAVNLLCLWVADATSGRTPSFSFFYIPHLDTSQHDFGPHHDCVSLELLGLESLLGQLAERLREIAPERISLVITSDHGQIYVPEERQYDISGNDRLLKLLEVPPTGEARNPIFHVHEGGETEFRSRFRDLVGEDFLLLATEDVESYELLGPGPLSVTTRQRLGTCLGVALAPVALLYRPPGGEPYRHLGFHGGLSSEEMRIPLIVV